MGTEESMATIRRALHEHLNTAFPAHVCLVATVLPNGFAEVRRRGGTMVLTTRTLPSGNVQRID